MFVLARLRLVDEVVYNKRIAEGCREEGFVNGVRDFVNIITQQQQLKRSASNFQFSLVFVIVENKQTAELNYVGSRWIHG